MTEMTKHDETCPMGRFCIDEFADYADARTDVVADEWYFPNCNISITESPKKAFRGRAFSSVAYTVKIPNFFTLPVYDNTNFDIKSPIFEFANARWYIRFEEGVKIKSDKGEEIKQFFTTIMRLNYDEPQQLIFFEIKLLGSEDKVYMKHSGTHIFQDSPYTEEMEWKTFNNGDPFCDKRDTLTLIINFTFSDPTKLDADTTPVSIDKGMISLCDAFKDVLLHGKDHNVIFDVGDKKFQAHRDILKARSEVFRSMLNHDMLEKKNGVVEVPDCDPKAFELLLNYVYTGKVESLDVNNMFDLYYAADKYQLPHLKEECCEFIKKSITMSNVCDALELASKHCDTGLLDNASNYFFMNVDDILVTVQWQNFMKANLTVANELFIKTLKQRPKTSQ